MQRLRNLATEIARIPPLRHVQRRTGRTAPASMTEGQPAEFISFDSGYDPAEPVDRAIMATRNAVFPLHGLMPFH